MDSIGVKISEIFTEKQNYDEKYNNLMFTFVTKAYELVVLSEGLYQVEHTIKLNQISLKDYILNSDVCNFLKDNNIRNYSISYLKDFMKKYESLNMTDITSYKLALELYVMLDDIKDIEKTKVDYEINAISNVLESIVNIEKVSKDKYQDLYNDLLQQVKENYLDNNLIDYKINNYVVLILNDIFNYYLYGNREVPVES